ncbi:hypothetical protein RE476_08590 [Methanolobus mangrovi]|uniref:Dockerin domain-containing protein n=1 Tax=Methanolobus mangrovi TaxID=3072977 RepID=A0AA51UEF8_9EURY|nr:hypothetical protein [Methanolobus mangrovi]WMW21459.1 hypothetical protein RE476_08590 [Methanolobus mangrovi]
MKKEILSFLLFFLLVNTAHADLYSDMGDMVPSYNQNVDLVPDVIIGLLGNEEMYGIVSMSDGTNLEIKAVTKDGLVVEFTKVTMEIEQGKGDYDNDGSLTALDGLGAIKMSTGKLPEDMGLDVDGNKKVNSLDGRIILQSAVGLSSELDPTVIVYTDEDTLSGLMLSEDPASYFLDAYESGNIEVEGVSFSNKAKLSVGNLILKISSILGLI